MTVLSIPAVANIWNWLDQVEQDTDPLCPWYSRRTVKGLTGEKFIR